MKRILALVLKYPAEVILALFFASFFMRYPEIATANLFILLAVILSYYLLLSGSRMISYLSPLPLIIGIACYYFLPSSLSYLFVSGSILFSLGLVLGSFKLGISEAQSQNISKMFTLGLAIMVLMPLTFNFGNIILSRGERARMTEMAENVERQIAERLEVLKATAPKIAQDSFVIDLLGESSYQDLAGYLQNLMISEGLDYLLVADQEGTVVARAHQAKMVGDDYANIVDASNTEDNFEGIFTENGRGFMASGRKIILSDGRTNGRIICGNFIDTYTPLVGDRKNAALSISRNGELLGVVGSDRGMITTIGQITKKRETITGLMQFRDQTSRIQVGKSHSSKYNVDIIAGSRTDSSSAAYLVNLFFYITSIIVTVILIRKKLGFEFLTAAKSRFFKRNEAKINSQIALVFLEIAFFSLLVYAVSVKSLALFGSQTKAIAMPNDSNQMSFRPYVRLDVSPYAKLSEVHRIKLMVEDLPEGNTTLRATINYSSQYFRAQGIEYDGGLCDTVFDKNIDEANGVINFSCVLKFNSSQSVGGAVAEVKLIPKMIGLAGIEIDSSYTNIQTSKGESQDTKQTFEDGEKILIGN